MPSSTSACLPERAPDPAPRCLRLASLLALPLFAGLTGCRAFPISLFVPGETLNVLETSEFVERLDGAELDRALARRFGVSPAPAGGSPPAPGGVRRVDLLPEPGPFAPEALNEGDHPALWDLESGDLLLAKNRKPQSLGQTLSFTDFTYYGHMAVLAREEGRLVVYESWPRLALLRTAEVFADRFEGGVQRVPFGRFLERYETIEVVRLEPLDGRHDLGARLALAARESLDEGIRYDPHHAPDDPALSCSEYVAYLIRDKLGAELELRTRTITENPSMRALLASLGFRTDGYIVPESFSELDQASPIALFTQHPNRAAYLGNLYAYRALHAHFEAGESISSYLGVHPLRLVRFRSNVSDFLEATQSYVEAHPHVSSETLERELQAMIELFFRPRVLD